MVEELDLNNAENLIDMLIYLRYLELGGSEANDEETDLGFSILSDNVRAISEGLGVDDISFKYNVLDKVLVDKSETKIKQSVYDKVSRDFNEIINLIKNYIIDNNMKPLKDKYDDLTRNL